MLDLTDTKKRFYLFFTDVVKNKFPEAQILFKNESMFMRVLGIVLYLINKDFMTRYVTVIGNNIYFPSRKWLEARHAIALEIIAHEYVHMVDRSALRLLQFEVQYLFPQVLSILSLFALFAFCHPLFLIFLVFIFALLPFPARWRTQIEANGYAMSMFFESRVATYSYCAKDHAYRISEKFIDSSYYWMETNRQKVVHMLLDRYESYPNSHPAFIEVDQWIKKTQQS